METRRAEIAALRSAAWLAGRQYRAPKPAHSTPLFARLRR
jgi:hypothetical protein